MLKARINVQEGQMDLNSKSQTPVNIFRGEIVPLLIKRSESASPNLQQHLLTQIRSVHAHYFFEARYEVNESIHGRDFARVL